MERNMSSENILIVDDDPLVREILEEIIVSQGHTCETTANGLEALNCFKQKDFDIIIADIKMPELDGLELMARVREMKPGLPFIIITGHTQDYSYDRVIGAGANDFIRKPFTTQELNTKLARIFEERLLEEKNMLLTRKQSDLNRRMSTLIAVASDLTSELDFDRLFPLIVGKVTESMSAERTSLYIVDWETETLWTKVSEHIDRIHLPLGEGISGRVAKSGEIINLEDAWEVPYFNREFDLKHNFRTKSVLCLPVKNHSGETTGVLQVMNKKGKNRFDADDEELLKSFASQVGIALENSLLNEELRLSFESSVSTLSATVDARHPFTAGHARRVTEYSLLIAREMGLNDQEMEVLKYAALLHDIGKIGIRDNVLLKNGLFTPEERAEMNKHPMKSKAILENFRFPKSLKDVPEIASLHHEKIDGTGYPDGLKGEQIPLGSKILAVADVFDALTSRRDYPKYTKEETLTCDPMPLSKAISILESDAGTHFAPEVVSAFLLCLHHALVLNRGDHFPPEYVDDTIRSMAPELLS